MTFLIGIDEAGYGPNLGPLVIAATVWEVPNDRGAEELYDVLDGVIADGSCKTAQGQLLIADSKVLYSPAKGFQLLERGVLTLLRCSGQPVTRWTEFWQNACCDVSVRNGFPPWLLEYDVKLPRHDLNSQIADLAEQMRHNFDERGVRLRRICCRVLFPFEFNCLLNRHFSKGELLTVATLELAKSLLDDLPSGSFRLTCDKHGGRNNYHRMLTRLFPDVFVAVHGESSARSVYSWKSACQRIEISFRVRGERWLEAAAASMAAKYVRELTMEPFNDYWQRLVSNLRPTAGYSVDAHRFKTEIAAAQAEIGMDDAMLWRTR